MCFSLDWLMHLLILGVVVGAIIAILQLMVPWALSKISVSGVIGEAINIIGRAFIIVFWAAVIILVIVIVFSLISCLWSMGGGFGTLFPHR